MEEPVPWLTGITVIRTGSRKGETEYLLNKPNHLDEARKVVAESVKLYNKYRPHTALKYKTLDEVHRAF